MYDLCDEQQRRHRGETAKRWVKCKGHVGVSVTYVHGELRMLCCQTCTRQAPCTFASPACSIFCAES